MQWQSHHIVVKHVTLYLHYYSYEGKQAAKYGNVCVHVNLIKYDEE